MSVALAIAALAARMALVNPAPSPIPQRVYPDPAEAVSLAEFPSIVLTLAPQEDQQWHLLAQNYGRHDYIIALYLFVGARQTGLPILHSLLLPWPKAIADILLGDVTLGGNVAFIGNGQDPMAPLFRYRIGPIEWSDGVYFGLKALIPITEAHNQPVA